MRIGPSHQAGSDSLLTASTFFKMRELYFHDKLDDAEYNSKLYGLGQTFSFSNGMAEPGRGGVTIAEREDRGSVREAHNQTPGPPVPANAPTQNVSMGIGPLPPSGIGGAITAPLSTTAPYTITANGYLRTTIVGGTR
jgi:CCR4-NOT transcription complex subunit 7/8